MKALSIISLVLTLIAGFIAIGFTIDVSQKRSWNYGYLNDYESAYQTGGDYNTAYGYVDDNYDAIDEATQVAGLICMVYFLFLLTYSILGIVKIKTTTMKVFSIIALSLTGIFILWDIIMITNPSGLSFDEVGPAFIIFMFFGLAYSIIGTVQSFRKPKQLPS